MFTGAGMRAQCGALRRQLDVSEMVVAGDDHNAVIVIMVPIVAVIVAARRMVLRGDCAGCVLNRSVRTNSTNMVGTAMQAFHVT